MDIILAPKKNVAFDATIFSSLEGCATFTDIRFNHQMVPLRGKSNSLEVGSLIHKVLEVYYSHIINGFPRTISIGQALAAGQMFIDGCPYCKDGETEKPECKHEPGEYPGMTNTPEQSEGHATGWKFALQTCEEYFEFYKNDALIPLFTEFVKGEVLYEDDEIRVLWKAKIDLGVDTNQIGIVSMDHKTFKQRRDKSSLSNQFIGQCLLMKSRSVIVNKIGLQSSYKIADRLSREVVSYSQDRLSEWQNETLPYYAYKYIQYKESGYWPPNYTHCDNVYGSCAYKQVCESDRNMRGEVLNNNYRKTLVWDPKNRERGMNREELIEALTALYTAARGDEKGEWWTIRKWMDEHDIFNDDIESYDRLSEIVLKYLLERI